MSKISLEPNASGAGTFTLAAPNSNTNRTLNLPDESGILFSDGSGVPGSAVAGQLASSNMPAGSVIQVVQGNTTQRVETSSTSNVDTGLQASITPFFGNSKVLITITQNIFTRRTTNEFADQIFLQLNRDNDKIYELFGGNGGIIAQGGSTAGTAITFIASACFLDSPSTTSATVYKTRFRSRHSNGPVAAQHNSSNSTITLMEIAG